MAQTSEPEEMAMAGRLIALGKRVREARYELGLSLEELGEKAGISAGLLSQIERGMGNPSYSTLVKLAHALDISFSSFYDGPSSPDGIVVRRDKRTKVTLPDREMIFELLSPDRNRRVELIRWGVPVGFGMCDLPGVHTGEETVFVIQGKLDMKVGDQLYHLDEGDSIYIAAGTPHWYGNPGDEVTICISANSPPYA